MRRQNIYIRTAIVGIMMVCVWSVLACAQEEEPVRPPSQEAVDPLSLLYRCRLAYDEVTDYTATFIKQQKVGGELANKEVIELKFMKPFSVYMKWITPNKGQEVIYSQGWNKNRLMAHPGAPIGLFSKIIPVVSLEPMHPLAMKGNRYPITQIGLGNLINRVIEQCELARMRGDFKSFYLGTEEVDEVSTHLIMRILPEKEGYEHYFMLMNIDKERCLPIKIAIYGWDYQLDGLYLYKDLKVNPGLTKEDFDPNNRKYDFGLIKIP